MEWRSLKADRQHSGHYTAVLHLNIRIGWFVCHCLKCCSIFMCSWTVW